MYDNKLYNLSSNKHVTNGLSIISLGSGLGFVLTEPINPVLSTGFLFSLFTLGSTDMVLLALNKKKQKYEEKEFAKEYNVLYKEFLDNYSNLNKTFDLKEPIELYTMFCSLYSNGYLSKNKSFTFEDNSENLIDGGIKQLEVSVFDGRACCRHIAKLFSDTLNHDGITSAVLACKSKVPDVIIREIDKPKHTLEELYDWVENSFTYSIEDYYDCMDEIDRLVNKEKKNIDISLSYERIGLSKGLIGNHAITFVNKDGYNYYLDPTNNKIYDKLNPHSNTLGCDLTKLRFRRFLSFLINDREDFKNLKLIKNKKYSTIGYTEEQSQVNSTNEKIDNNIDIIEDFYKQNEELYGEITNKVLEYTRKKNIKGE